jgi:hypothetical protein
MYRKRSAGGKRIASQHPNKHATQRLEEPRHSPKRTERGMRRKIQKTHRWWVMKYSSID